MKQIQINLLELDTVYQSPESSTPFKAPQKRTWFSGTAILFSSIAMLLIGTSVFSYYSARDEDSKLNKTFHRINIIGALQHFSESVEKKLDGEKDGRINILLLGVGGGTHEGTYLSDTNMIMSIKPDTHQVAMISIPRDLQVYLDGYGWRKINNASAFGEMKEPGSGGEYAKEVISKTFNVPIQYYIRVDFSGFEKIIDILGGVNVVVENSFTDYQYPTENKKYQVVSFQAGPQVMDGQTALEFARSRHSMNNNEGSDFARSRRQQLILQAVKDKVLSSELLLRPQKISEILKTLQENIVTNLQPWELLKLGRLIKDVHTQDITNIVFDDGPGGFLYSQIEGGAYVLKPKDDTFAAMSERIQNVFHDSVLSQPGNVPSKQIRIIVKNGTQVSGLASTTADQLRQQGYTISYIGNALDRTKTQTVIYDLTNGGKPAELQTLSKALSAKVIQGETDEKESFLPSADFLIVLGKS